MNDYRQAFLSEARVVRSGSDRTRRPSLLVSVACVFASLAALARRDARADSIDCDVAIVGGGASGLYTALRLAPSLHEKVCLFEKEKEVGGRFTEEPSGQDGDPALPKSGFPTGGIRVYRNQEQVFKLCDEMKIPLRKGRDEPDAAAKRLGFAMLMQGRNEQFTVDPDEIGALYDLRDGTCDMPAASGKLSMCEIEKRLLSREIFKTAVDETIALRDKAISLREYIDKTFKGNKDIFEFLHDTTRFRGDFDQRVNGRAYMDFLDEEVQYGPETWYPVGGMSALMKAMRKAAEENKVRFFVNEAVTEINDRPAGATGATVAASAAPTYTMKTSNSRVVNAKRLVLAVPPTALEKIRSGTLIPRITSQPQFKAILPVKLFTVEQWFKTRWWDKLFVPSAKVAKNMKGGAPEDKPIWRIFTTERTKAHNINFVETPTIDKDDREYYGDGSVSPRAIRTVYNDDEVGVTYLENIFKREGTAGGGTAGVAAEVKAGLTYLLDQAFAQGFLRTKIEATELEPVKTHVKVWDTGWVWLKAGQSYSNRHIFMWAARPLAGEPVGLVGDGYNAARTGWSDGAYKTAIHLLMLQYGDWMSPDERAKFGVDAKYQPREWDPVKEPQAPKVAPYAPEDKGAARSTGK